MTLVIAAACSCGVTAAASAERPEAAAVEAGGGHRQRWDCVAFVADGDIYVVNLDGTGLTRLTDDDADFSPAFSPAFSPDGTKIAYDYFRFERDYTAHWAVYVMNADGTDKRRLSPSNDVLPGDWDDGDCDPEFAPDGERVAVKRHYKSNIDIIFLPTSGGPEENFSTKIEDAWERERRDNYGSALPPRNITLPVFSGDARTVAFSDYAGVSGSRLWIANADGSGVRLLARGDVYSPALSPDGTKLAFEAETEEGTYIFVINADGTGRRQLTKGDRDRFSPAFSPDGKKIIYVSDGDINVMNADGSEPRALTQMPDGAWFFRFTPDCSKIVFCTYWPWYGDSVEHGIYVMNADGSGRRFLGAGYDFSLGPSLVEGRLVDSYGNWHDAVDDREAMSPGE